jgi:hypothetical protein
MIVSAVMVLLVLSVSATLARMPSTVYATPETFGVTSAGNSNVSTFGGLYVSNFTSPSNFGTITQISVYLATGGTSAEAVIFSDNNGRPGRLLAASSTVYQEGTSGSWVNFPVTYTGTPNTVYWFGILFFDAGTYYFAKGVSGEAIYSNSTSPGQAAPSTFPSGSYGPTDELSAYATYIPHGESSPTATPRLALSPSGLSAETIYEIVAAVIVIVLIAAAVMMTKRKKGLKSKSGKRLFDTHLQCLTLFGPPVEESCHASLIY